MSQEYFIGIDLGTTNSLMAWSRVDSNEKLRTEIVDISMIDESGGKIKKMIGYHQFYTLEKIFQ